MQKLRQIKAEPYRVIFQGPVDGLQKIYQVFNRSIIESNNLEDTILFNQYIFTNTYTKAFPNAFLEADFEENEDVYIFSQPSYKQTLQDYIRNKTVTEKDAIQIFGQILKSIYSLTVDNLAHRNIRPEHFALVDGQWKLRAAVFSSENYGIDNQFTINSKYQAPEEYENDSDTVLDQCPIIVWNLGSILLDMVMDSHVLNNQKILMKFRDKEFSLKSIGSNIKVSYEFESYLSQMLHYKPEHRIKLNEIYERSYFSREVAKHYKENKTKVVHSIKQVAKSSGLRSSLRESMSLKNSIAGSKIPKNPNLLISSSRGLLTVPQSNELIRQSMRLLDIDKNASRQFLMTSKKNQFGSVSTVIQEQDEFFSQLAEKTKIFPKLKRAQQENDPSTCTIDKDQWMKNIFGIYKTFVDRSELLCISVNKFSQIPYEDKLRNQFILLNEFSVYYVSLIELEKICRAINKGRNIYKINRDKFDEFLRSNNYQVFRQQINKLFLAKKQDFQQKARLLLSLPQGQKNLMKFQRFIEYVEERNIYENSFTDIKKPYRQILKMTYDKISVLFNTRKEQILCRLSLYTVYCMTIDKLYIEEDIEDNFSFFIQWDTLKSNQSFQIDSQNHFTISVSHLQKYFDTAPIKMLIEHSKKILRKYYKI